MKGVSPETIGQQLIRGLINVCFAFFVVAVLAFTVLAIVYQPPDPWLEPGNAISKVLNSVQNATFRPDDSVLRTGEDFASENSKGAEAQDAITETTVIAALGESPSPGCDPQEEKQVNCSDSGVLAAIASYNLKHFPNLKFFQYQAPVRGGEEDECDVSWRFRAKKEKSWRMYRDYRRFSLKLDEACSYKVAHAGEWHSGKNAKPLKSRRGAPKLLPPKQAAIPAGKNQTLREEVEVIEDSVPSNAAPDSTFRNQKYLYYSRGGDHCKPMNQYTWSFLCALGEAQYLNRTFVVDLSICLSWSNNPGHGDEDDKDFRYYFDFAHLKDAASVVEQQEFLEEWNQWNQKHVQDPIAVREVTDLKITPMELQQDQSTIIWRKFELPEPDNYWYRVCEAETEKVIQRPWHLLWKSKRIMDLVNAICGQMDWDFDAVHVVRGEKAKNKELWPNLDADTSVDSIIDKLRDQIDTSRNVYIATNEMEPGYFNPLKEIYSHAYTLDDFSALWAKDSLWYNQTMELSGGRPVVFDGYMRIEVDTEVSYRAKKKIETFDFLTKDCKDGVNTC